MIAALKGGKFPMPKTKKCPFCAEKIQAAAVLCRYCHSDLPEVVYEAGVQAFPQKSVSAKKPKLAGFVVTILTILGMVGSITVARFLGSVAAYMITTPATQTGADTTEAKNDSESKVDTDSKVDESAH